MRQKCAEVVFVVSLCLALAFAQIQFGGNTRNSGFTNQNGRQSSNSVGGGRGRCSTVSGPNPGKPCIFPFTYQGVTYKGCPIDPEDSSKRWCSTRTDRSGNHVTGQGEYGHCDQSCPIHRSQSNNKRRPGSAPRSEGCAGSETCHAISACALRYRVGELLSKACVQSNGAAGLCCNDVTSNRNIAIPRLAEVVSLRGVSNEIIPNGETRRVLDIGESFFSNVTRSYPRNVLPRNSGTFTHTRLQKPKKGTQRLQRLAVIAMEAARSLRNGGKVQPNTIAVRGADTRNTVLEDCYDPITCDQSMRYRTIDGSCNNLRNPLQGREFTPLNRILDNAYSDHMNLPRLSSTGSVLTSARIVSTATNPNSNQLTSSAQNTALFMSFGQFLDHDLSHVPIQVNDGGAGINCCTEDGQFADDAEVSCFPIKLPANDQTFGGQSCMNFVRSQSSPNFECVPGATEQMNQITHWLDSSNVYGSNEEEADRLRSKVNGLLKTDFDPSGKELLPTNENESDCKGDKKCFLAGDARVNEQPNLVVMHTIFVREHNRVARILKSINPQWNDEVVYQEAKRVVNAEWQHVVYNEYLPILLGSQFMEVFGILPLNGVHSTDYRNDFDARITNEFASAAFRVGHTMIPSLVKLLTARRRQGSDSNGLSRFFFNVDTIREGKIDDHIRSIISEPIEEVDNKFTPEVTERLFDGALNGMDLVALNIQRARDHGIPSYVSYRRICLVGNARTFDDLSNVISRENIELLKRVYDRVEDIDLFVGMSMERPHTSGALVGETFLCLIGDQFARLKKGDRFFYDLKDQSGSFTLDQLEEIRKTSMARLLCDNSDDLKEIQPLAFRIPLGSTNQPTSCNDFRTIPSIDFSPWRQ
ncbi:peroxidase-like [Tigriopus californicus]|uniref:peroxidase-like n=1 Tax=Tigriopus californicus TaxID=6832 RepID=UPI0027DA159B|nr:peroxidase-like [Tigriopus californicus]